MIMMHFTKHVADDAAQRIGIQLPRARCTRRIQKRYDLAREAVNCNAVLDGGAGMGIFMRSGMFTAGFIGHGMVFVLHHLLTVHFTIMLDMQSILPSLPPRLCHPHVLNRGKTIRMDHMSQSYI